jgi:hypothetical protein
LAAFHPLLDKIYLIDSLQKPNPALPLFENGKSGMNKLTNEATDVMKLMVA